MLAAAVERIGYDIVVCGMASTDGWMGAVPSMVAERLGVPQISLASRLSLDGDRGDHRAGDPARHRDGEGTLPALVSVTDRTGEARYPSFKGIMAAKKKQVETWTLADLGIDASQSGSARAYTKVLSATARPPRTAGEMVTDDGDGGGRLAAFLGTQKFI